jgi:transposase InsO family protein
VGSFCLILTPHTKNLTDPVYLRPAANGLEQKRSLAEFFDWYNRQRPHQALGWQTLDEAYFSTIAPTVAEAA